MLKEIRCSLFNHQVIEFHQGLNIILGDDDAKNSIGKSTALMVLDFAHGGDSFLKDESGAIRELGQHYYNFCFVFSGQAYYYSRSTDVSDIVYVCNKNYARQSDLSVENFRRKLKELYELTCLESSFRSIVSPFSRIWKKGGLEPDHPFISSPKETSGVAVGRLIDVFGRSVDIAAEKKVIDEQKERKKLISDSMSAKLIPEINKTQYKLNSKIITETSGQIEKLKNGFGGALNAYEELFDENLRSLQQHKNDLINLRGELEGKIKRLQREISGITPRLTANISLVAEFFPTVDVTRLGEVEAFHQKIGNIVRKELKDELATAYHEDSNLLSEIVLLEQRIQITLNSKGMPDDLFNRLYELKDVADKATQENKIFEIKIQLDDAIELSSKRLDVIYTNIFIDIEFKINSKLRAFNKVVYGPSRNSSELRIKGANSYSFSSPADTGTGKSYAGLIGFDIAMLALTKIPFAMHDSVIYKNIEVEAVRRILRILAAVKLKQVFLSFDEAKKFGSHVEQLIKKFTVLKLSNNDLLYKKDWRDKK